MRKTLYYYKPTGAILEYCSYSSDMDIVKFWIVRGSIDSQKSPFSKSIYMDIGLADEDCDKLDMDNHLIKELLD